MHTPSLKEERLRDASKNSTVSLRMSKDITYDWSYYKDEMPTGLSLLINLLDRKFLETRADYAKDVNFILD